MSLLRLGFTGSSKRITLSQQSFVADYMQGFMESCIQRKAGRPEFHHGDCIVADAFAHRIAKELGYWIVIHPPEVYKKRAFCEGADEIRPELPYHDRNLNIVRATQVILACPDGPERRRSGTWSTVRRARENDRPVFFADQW